MPRSRPSRRPGIGHSVSPRAALPARMRKDTIMTNSFDPEAGGRNDDDLDGRINIVDPLGGDRDRDDAPLDQDADADQVDSADANQRAATEGTKDGDFDR